MVTAALTSPIFWIVFCALIIVAVTTRKVVHPLGRRRVHSQIKQAVEFAIAKDRPGSELDIPKEKPPVFDTYGHPAPPIPLLASSVPTAPTGFRWEITVHNEDDAPTLKLAMLHVVAGEVATIEADLTVARHWKYAPDDTYAMLYRKAGRRVTDDLLAKYQAREYAVSRAFPPVIIAKPDPNEAVEREKGKVMMANLIDPMVDWARVLTLRYITNNPDPDTCQYMLVKGEAA